MFNLKTRVNCAYIATLASLFCASSLFFACSKEESKSVLQETLKEVEVAYPTEKSVEIWDKFEGRIEGEKSIEVRSRVSGYLEKICFKDGDFVKKGDLLFEIDSRPFMAIVDANKATVEEIESKILLAKNNLVRAESLYKENAVSREVYETRLSQLKTLEAQLLMAQARLREANLNLEFTKICAPVSGFMGKRLVDEGNLITQNSTHLASLVSREFVYVYFDVSERDVIRYTSKGILKFSDSTHVKPLPVRIRLMDEKSPSAEGVLTYVNNNLDAGSLEFRADIKNEKNRLFPGMFAEVLFRAGDPQKKLLLPRVAVGRDLVGRYIYVVDENEIVRYRPVVLGEIIGDMVVVEEGLKESERVIVNGLQRAVADKKIKATLQKESQKK